MTSQPYPVNDVDRCESTNLVFNQFGDSIPKTVEEFLKHVDEWIKGPFESDRNIEELYKSIHQAHSLLHDHSHYEEMCNKLSRRRRSSVLHTQDRSASVISRQPFPSRHSICEPVKDIESDSNGRPHSPYANTTGRRVSHFGHHIAYENRDRSAFEDWLAKKRSIDVSHNPYYDPYHTHNHHFEVCQEKNLSEEEIREKLLMEYHRDVDESLKTSFACQLYKTYLMHYKINAPNYLKDVEPLDPSLYFYNINEEKESTTLPAITKKTTSL